MTITVFLWLFFIILLIGYATISEIRSQDCIDTCENIAPIPNPSDTPEELRVKIQKGTQVIYNSVDWRKSLFIAILSLIFVFICISYLKWKTTWSEKSEVPRGIDAVIGTLSVFLIVYLVVFTYLQENYWKPLAIQINTAAGYI